MRALGAFVLTTVVGTILTTCWQTRQWNEQQQYTARVERAKAQLEVTNAVTQKVSDAFSSNNQIIFLSLLGAKGNAKAIRKQQLNLAVEDWIKQNRSWRVDEAALLAQTSAYFTKPRVHTLLTQILDNRQKLFVKVREFVEESHAEPVPSKEGERRAKLHQINRDIYLLVRDTTARDPQDTNPIVRPGLMQMLVEEMISEIRDDQVVKKVWWQQLLAM
jgi:hypothetical protein